MRNKPERKNLKTLLENFIESDSLPATAGKFLLMTVALGGIVFAGALVPGILALTEGAQRSKKYTPKQIRNAFYNLKKRRFVEIIRENDGKIKVKLTHSGNARIREFSIATLKIKKPLHWDKKWRILIFDIPTKPKIYHQAREALRNKIKELGFYQMQKSVWVYPYECTDELLLIAELFQVQKHIEILTVEKLLHENEIKKVFKL